MFFNYFRQQRRVSKLAKWQHKPVKQVVLDVADKTPKIQQWAAALVAKNAATEELCFNSRRTLFYKNGALINAPIITSAADLAVFLRQYFADCPQREMYIDCVANTVPKLAPLLKTLLHNKITLQLYGMAQVASVSDATPECEWHWDQKQLVCKTTLHINTIDVGRNPYEIDKSGNLTLKDSFINAAVTAKKQRYVFDATTTIVFSSQQESLTANIHDIKIDFFSNRLNCKSNVTMVEEQQPSQARPGF